MQTHSPSPRRPGAFTYVALIASLVFSGCSARDASPDAAKADSANAAAAMAMHDGMDMPVTIPPGVLYTAADIHFMQGMIAHHAQAIYMARMAESHNATPRLVKFALKIDQSQRSEIQLMQQWLVAHGQFAPDTNSYQTMHMPGMLTAEQLTELDAAKGADFNKKFLTLMIQHHEGALKMVADLLATPLAAQDVDVSVFANDIVTVQTAEIDAMHQMLADL